MVFFASYETKEKTKKSGWSKGRSKHNAGRWWSMNKPKKTFTIYRCIACTHEWPSRLKRKPKLCPKCKRLAVEIDQVFLNKINNPVSQQ